MADPRPGKMTLIEIVQNVLSAMDSDEVNSIGDTVEALQVAEIAKETFYEIIGGLEEPHRSNAFRLDSVSDVNRPNYLKLPAQVKDVEAVYYNYLTDSKDTWTEIKYISPGDFIRMSLGRSTGDDVTAVTDFSGASHYIVNNDDPTYYTSFDDEYLVFDSWDLSKESTLQEHKSQCLGTQMPSFDLEDTFIPDIPADYFPLLLAEVKQSAFVNLKQVSNSIEDRRARRQRVRLLNNLHRAKRDKKYNEGINYGRKPNH
jgi:hypothetical protein